LEMGDDFWDIGSFKGGDSYLFSFKLFNK